MKKFLTVLVASMLVTCSVLAQNSVTAGSKSLNFTFGGFGGFGMSGTGPLAGVGASFFLTSRSAIRIGLQASIYNETEPANPGPNQTGKDGEISTLTLGVSADYLMYMGSATSRLRPYLGAGISFEMITDTRKNDVIDPTPQTETKGIGAGTNLGLKGILGAEFFLYPELSISAEYSLNLYRMYSPADLEVTSGSTTTTRKQTSSNTILGFGSAGAAIHFYF